MKVCFPTTTLQGLESPVYEHFGSAPGFVIVDLDTMSVTEVNNQDLHHAQGACQPLKALGGCQVHAVAVGGIGRGALQKLQALGVEVYRAVPGSVKHNLNLMRHGLLMGFEARQTCGGHGGGGCVH